MKTMNSKIQLSRTITKSVPSKRKFSSFVWKIADIGLDNAQDGIIEQSLLENSYRNLELIFHKDQSGVIVQKKEVEPLSFLFGWEVDNENSSVAIFSEHPLFRMKTKWSIQQLSYKELRLSYSIKLAEQNITVMMRMEGDRIKRRIRAKAFLQMILLPLFYL
jgi:hypothetical protein